MAAGEPRLTLDVDVSGNRYVVAVAGVLDLATSDILEARVLTQLRPEACVIIDLSGVRLCDSTGLGVLVRLYRRAVAAGAGLALRGARRQVADVLAMTGIGTIVPVLPPGDA
jgi:anti-anti-sigma factor